MGQREALRRQIASIPKGLNRISEAKGAVHAFRAMKRIGYKLEAVSLHYSGNQGVDMVFSQAGKYAVVEAKHGAYLSLLKNYKGNLRQGELRYNVSRLRRYLRRGDGKHNDLVNHLLGEAYGGRLDSFARFYSSGKLFELGPSWPKVPAIPR